MLKKSTLLLILTLGCFSHELSAEGGGLLSSAGNLVKGALVANNNSDGGLINAVSKAFNEKSAEAGGGAKGVISGVLGVGGQFVKGAEKGPWGRSTCCPCSGGGGTSTEEAYE